MKRYLTLRVAVALTALAVMLLANASTALAIEAVYDFDSLTPDLPLGGQDNWVSDSYAYVANDGSAQFVTADRCVPLTRKNDTNFSFPGLGATETAAVMEVDVRFAGLDPAGGAAVWLDKGPYLGMAGIGGGPTQFYARGGAGTEYGLDIGTAASPGDWVRMRLDMDLTSKVAGHEDLGPGVGVLSYKNLTLGETSYTTVMTDIPLNITALQTDGGIGGSMNLQYWTGTYPMGQVAVDNIRVESAADWVLPVPNPPTNYSQTILADSPAAYWRLADPADSMRPYEEVTQNFRGFWGGGESFEQPGALASEPAITSTGYRSTGPTMSAPGNDLFADQSQLTLEMWVKPVGGDSEGIHYFEWGWSDFSLEGSEPTPRWYVNNTFMGDVDLTSEEWAHVAFVFDGDSGEARIYKNGQEISFLDSGVPSAITSTPTQGKSNFMLANLEGDIRFVDGDFQELAIFQQALTAEQILAHYNASLGASLPGDANRDGIVNNEDAATLADNWMSGPDATWSMGDFNDDGYVNDIDATLLATNWQTSTQASVPEPSSTALLLGLSAMVFLCVRRHFKDQIMNNLKIFAAILVATAVLALPTTCTAADVTYDFESLTGGSGVLGTPIEDQDNWQQTYGAFTYVTTLDGSQVITADSWTRLYRENDANFAFPGLADGDTNVVMEMDIRYMSSAAATAYYTQGPWLGIAGIVSGPTKFYARAADNGTEYGVDIDGRVTDGEWVRMRLDMDISTSTGIGELSYKNLSRGESSYTSLMTGIDLGITSLYGGVPADMNVFLEASNYPLLNAAIDNIRVQTNIDWSLDPTPPNPSTNYSQAIMADSPSLYMRLAESSTPYLPYRPYDEVTQDFRGNFGGGEQFGQSGALAAEPQITATGYHSGGNTLSVPIDDLMGGATALTVEMWVKPNGDSTSGIHWLEGGTNSDFSLEGSQLSPNWYINNSFAGSLSLDDGTWQHLAFVFDGSTGDATLYKDGVFVSTNTVPHSAINDISTFYLGSRGGTQRFVDADFQELVMFESALSGAQIAAHYNASLPSLTAIPEPTGLALLLSGMGLLAAYRSRRGKA